MKPATIRKEGGKDLQQRILINYASLTLFKVINDPDKKKEGLKGAANPLVFTESSFEESEIITDLKNYLAGDIKLMVIGNTNVGKSTFLNNLLGISGILNTSEKRETACLWVLKTHDEYSQKKIGKYSMIKKWKTLENGKELSHK
jgi:tRNA U34 5-carboxymethylaminomethyl modifying GTPase MnmE/TrmE